MHYLLMLLLVITVPAKAQEPLRIAVAANFRSTLGQISELFRFLQLGFRDMTT